LDRVRFGGFERIIERSLARGGIGEIAALAAAASGAGS
jgi:hypothetical protein